MEREVFRDARPQVHVTNPDDPEEGRCFVWAKGRWYERVEGQTGAVEFPYLADSDQDLREVLIGTDAYDEKVELDDDFASEVRREFMEQTPLYPEAPELSQEYRTDDE
ncbi:MAG: hypothetical protein WD208_05140 [Dehalococcoidia bacterium]